MPTSPDFSEASPARRTSQLHFPFINQDQALTLPPVVVMLVAGCLLGAVPVVHAQGTAPAVATPAATAAAVATAPQRRARYDAGQMLSRSGSTGLIRMPSAALTGDGMVRITGFSRRKNEDITRLGNSTTTGFSIGLLPRLEIGAAIGSEYQGKDLTANAKVLVLRESARYPAVAVGVAELQKLSGQTLPAGFPAGSTAYGVATKSFLDGKVGVTAGVARSRGYSTKPFGGVEVALHPCMSAVLERDTRDFNYGVRGAVLHNRVQLGVFHVEEGWRVHGGITMPLDVRKPAPFGVVLPTSGAKLPALAAAGAMQSALTALGLENVDVRLMRAANASTVASTVRIAYENRSFSHSEMDALANVLAIAAVYAPEGVERLAVTILRDGLPVLAITVPHAAYRRYMANEIDRDAFAAEVVIEQAPKTKRDATEIEVGDDQGVSTARHGDLFLRPGLRTAVATEDFFVGTAFSLKPELDLHITRGITLNAMVEIPVAGPDELRKEKTTLERLTINGSLHPMRNVLARGYAGRFPSERDGAWAEAVWLPDNSRFTVRGAAGLLHRRDGVSQSAPFLGEARYYLPSLDASVRLGAGRYIEGDKGFVAGLARRFGDTEVELQVRDTDVGRAGVVKLAMPLGPGHIGSKPSAVRLRPPDFFDYNHRSLLTRPNVVNIANLTGNELAVGGDATRAILDRDRLNRPYVIRSLPLLREIRAIAEPQPGASN